MSLLIGTRRALLSGGVMIGGAAPESAAARATRYGVVAAWNLADVSDSYGANTLTNSLGAGGVVFAPAKVGNGAHFNPAIPGDVRLWIADNPALSAGDVHFGLAGWVLFNDTGAIRAIVSKGHSDVPNPSNYNLYRYTDNKIYFEIGTGASMAYVGTAAAVSSAAAHFLVAYHDSGDNQIALSIDGGAFVTASHATGLMDTAHDFSLGGNAAPQIRILDGYLDAWVAMKPPAAGAAFWVEVRDYLFNAGAGREYPAGWT